MSSAERAAIEAALPHRDPFLFADRIAAAGPEWIEVEWTVPLDADWIRGHYPGFPVLPGVLLCEHAVQAGALLVARLAGGFRAEDGPPVLTRLGQARFRRMLRPGELVSTRAELVERVGPAWFLRARASAPAGRALDLEFALSCAGALARAAEGG